MLCQQLILPLLVFYSDYAGASDARHKSDTFNLNHIEITALGFNEKNIFAGTSQGFIKIQRKSGKWVRYHSNNSRLPSDKVTDILVLPDNKVWIGTDKGLLCYDGYSFYTLTSENSKLPAAAIKKLASNHNGNLIVLLANGELWMESGLTFKKLKLAVPAIRKDSVIDIFSLGQNKLAIQLQNLNVVYDFKKETITSLAKQKINPNGALNYISISSETAPMYCVLNDSSVCDALPSLASNQCCLIKMDRVTCHFQHLCQNGKCHKNLLPDAISTYLQPKGEKLFLKM